MMKYRHSLKSIDMSKHAKKCRWISVAIVAGGLFFSTMPYGTPFQSVAYMAVQMYSGVGEDYGNQWESPDIVKKRAREKAIQSAKEQAGVILKNYSRSINAALTDDEISVITADTYQVIGEPAYERRIVKVTDASTVVVWKATVNLNIDDNEIRKWIGRKDDVKANLVKQNKELEHAIAVNDRQIEELRERARNAATEEERNALKAEFAKVDNDFLYILKMKEANRLFYNGQTNNALNASNEAIELNPRSAEAYKLRGDCYARRGKNLQQENEKALSDYNKAIELNPNYADAYVKRGVLHSNMKEYSQAKKDYDMAIQIDPKNSDAYLARSALGENQFEDLDMAVKVDPDNARPYAVRGLSYYTFSGDKKRALADLEKAVQLDPNNIWARISRVMVFLQEKEYDNALIDCNKIIDILPENADLYNLRSSIHKALGENEKAIADHEAYKRLQTEDSPAEYPELAAKEKASQGDLAFKSKRYDEAIAAYDDAIQANPNDAELYMKRGDSYEETRDYEKALSDYSKAIQLDGGSAQIYQKRANAYLGTGNRDNAENDYKKAVQLLSEDIKKSPDDFNLYLSRGSIYGFSLHEYQKAIDDHTKGIQLYISKFQSIPEDAQGAQGVLRGVSESLLGTWYGFRAQCYEALGDTANAEADYARAKNPALSLSANTNDAVDHFNRGVDYGNKGDYERALSEYSQAIKLNPKYAVAYNNRGNVYYSQEKYDQAIDDYSQAISLSPKDAVMYDNRGNTYYAKEDYDRAVADYGQAISLDPKDYGKYNHRGNAYYRQGNYGQAIADYDQAISLNPKDAVLYNNRGNAYYAKEDYDRAVADYGQAISLDPKDDSKYNNRGNAYYRQGKYDQAIADYSQAISLNSKDAVLYDNRGNAYYGKGDYDQAIADFKCALKINPEYASAKKNLQLATNAKNSTK